MLLYLDLNCFNRPFDDQSQERIVDETAAVLAVLTRIDAGRDRLVWSAVIAFENSQHPLPDRCREIALWEHRASKNIGVSQSVAFRAKHLNSAGVSALDAVHLACAEAGGCQRLLTCDDRFIRIVRNRQLSEVAVLNPIEYLKECEHAGTSGE